MAKAASRATTTTTLVIGQVEVPVGLFSTVEKPGRLAEFTTAGPSGGVLKAESFARPVPVDEESDAPDQPVRSDPLAGDGPALSIDKMGPTRDLVTGEEIPADDPRAQEAAAIAEEVVESAQLEPGKAIMEPKTDADRAEPIPPDVAERQRETYERATSVDGEYGRRLVEDGTGVVVAPEDVRRGVRLEDGRFIDCTEQIAAIEQQTKLESMTVVAFVDITKVPRTRVAGAYYLGAADEKAPRALRIMFEALKRSRRGAVVKLTKRSRQSLGVIAPAGNVMVLLELVWSEDFRPAPGRATRIQKEQVSEREVDAFCQLIVAMSDAPAALDELRDDAIAMREELMVKALAGEVAEVVVPKPITDQQDVLAQLEASLAAVES